MTWVFDDKLPIYLQIILREANIKREKSCLRCANWR